jgi:hypothetical protein
MLVPDVVACAVPETSTVPVAVPVKVGLASVGDVKETPDTILDDPTDAGLFGIAFNTELT